MPSLLSPVLRFNAALSLSSGLLLTAMPATIGGWLGLSADGWLRLLGVVLFAHGMMILAGMSLLELRRVATLNFLAIAPYPALMVAVVATGVIDRPLGQALALLDGAIVGAVAIVHGLGLRGHAPLQTSAAQ